jgi:hypothetical protein
MAAHDCLITRGLAKLPPSAPPSRFSEQCLIFALLLLPAAFGFAGNRRDETARALVRKTRAVPFVRTDCEVDPIHLRFAEKRRMGTADVRHTNGNVDLPP